VTASVAPGLPGVFDGSVAWGDFDNDGRLDFLLTGATNSVPPQLWRNTGGGFSNVTARVAPGLPGLYSSSGAWGDFDNDGRLDFLLTGSGISQLWRNDMPIASNAPPATPTGLSSTLSGTTVSLSWNPPADDLTPSTGLNYNLRIGTTPGASDVLAPMALTDGLRLLPALGNAQAGTDAVMKLPFGRYYWSVQAVDTSFAVSPFAVEQRFTIAPRLDIARTNPAQVRLSWPTNYPGFQLLRASALDGSASWSNHPMSPVVMGSNYTITQPTATNREFFRLKQP
jgi:hypothetical protein